MINVQIIEFDNRKYINLGYLLKFVQIHYNEQEDEFKKECYKLMRLLDEYNLYELSEFIQAQMSDVNTFIPMNESDK